jgi:hypothetical protein
MDGRREESEAGFPRREILGGEQKEKLIRVYPFELPISQHSINTGWSRV